MTTTEPAAAAARIGAALAARKRGELLGLLQPCFMRVEPWLQAGKYVGALASGLPRRNGWTIAQQAEDRAPLRTQRLLSRAVWDAFAAMRVVRRFAVAGLDDAARRAGWRRGLRVGAIDETSQVKQALPRPVSNGSTWGARARWPMGLPRCACRMCASGPGMR